MSPQHGPWRPLYACDSTPGKLQQQRNTFYFPVGRLARFIQGTTPKVGWEIKFTATRSPQTGMASSDCLWDKDKKGGSRGLSGGKTGVRLESAGLESLKLVTYSEWSDRERETGSAPAPGNQLEPWWMKHSLATKHNNIFRWKTESALKPHCWVNGAAGGGWIN